MKNRDGEFGYGGDLTPLPPHPAVARVGVRRNKKRKGTRKVDYGTNILSDSKTHCASAHTRQYCYLH
jgi:hypothetical protein